MIPTLFPLSAVGLLKELYNTDYDWVYVEGAQDELIRRIKLLSKVEKARLGIKDADNEGT